MIRSLDEPLSPQDLQKLEEGLIEFPELKEEQEKLLAFRHALTGQTHAFRSFFSARVMNKIDGLREEKVTAVGLPSLTPAFSRLAIPCLGVCLVLLISLLFQEQEVGWNLLTGSSEIELADLWLASLVHS
ncbi:MAG: hypothetical protein AAF388_28905 [Bacteroidota bacterium]